LGFLSSKQIVSSSHCRFQPLYSPPFCSNQTISSPLHIFHLFLIVRSQTRPWMAPIERGSNHNHSELLRWFNLIADKHVSQWLWSIHSGNSVLISCLLRLWKASNGHKKKQPVIHPLPSAPSGHRSAAPPSSSRVDSSARDQFYTETGEHSPPSLRIFQPISLPNIFKCAKLAAAATCWWISLTKKSNHKSWSSSSNSEAPFQIWISQNCLIRECINQLFPALRVVEKQSINIP